MNKYGVVTENSRSDFDNSKKAEYYDEDGFNIADEKNKHLLETPKKIEQKAIPAVQ
jgi:hypothetical protein